MKNSSFFKLTFWKAVGTVIFLVGAYSAFLRFTQGLGATTHLSDKIPWGLWIGFDFIGVGLAAAGFTIAATVHIFNVHKFEPIVRPSILIAYVGYSLVVLLLIVDLGRPENFWHPLIMWNHHSVMFEITWCIICYTTVLTLEFAPVVLEKFNLHAPKKLLRKISIPVVIAGVLFSTLHQSSFGSLYLIVPGLLHPLWYSSLLPVHFYLSCIGAGLSMVVFSSYMNARAFNTSLKMDILRTLAKVIWIALIIAFVVKVLDLGFSNKLGLLFLPGYETYMFWLEMLAGSIAPIILLSVPKFRESKMWLYFISILTISGFVLNRLNVTVTGLTAKAGETYFPSFHEISTTMAIVVVGLFAFSTVIKYFSVFEEEGSEHEEDHSKTEAVEALPGK
jgi:Ni/Fe-hydrogenase subunit HybB-like protein